jgi:hypothetical protein
VIPLPQAHHGRDSVFQLFHPNENAFVLSALLSAANRQTAENRAKG